jgi:hypothetical protein
MSQQVAALIKQVAGLKEELKNELSKRERLLIFAKEQQKAANEAEEKARKLTYVNK